MITEREKREFEDFCIQVGKMLLSSVPRGTSFLLLIEGPEGEALAHIGSMSREHVKDFAEHCFARMDDPDREHASYSERKRL